MSSASNPPDIETRARTFHLPGHPGVEYSVTVVRPAGRGAQGWTLAEVTVRSTGGPLAVEKFASTEQLVAAVLYEDPWHMAETPYDSTRELDRVPGQYRRALYLRGLRTVDDLLELSDEQILAIRGIGARGTAIVADARDRYAVDRAMTERAG
ncbi:helix-hairpin-helix domain-containing protein [Nocardia tengchongensis]|uniref:helix-hairpin-helix domain-containing protein n=1 Tax=Nocardia tengchongensis TaxID=2055889 RepID=UPI0036AA99D0